MVFAWYTSVYVKNYHGTINNTMVQYPKTIVNRPEVMIALY